MSDVVIDASLALQWFLDDEIDREYSLAALAFLARYRAAVPPLWFYEVGNGLSMAFRRKRIRFDQIIEFLTRLKSLPIEQIDQTRSEIFDLPQFAQTYGLTNYDAAYLALAINLRIPLATTDRDLHRAAAVAGVHIASF